MKVLLSTVMHPTLDARYPLAFSTANGLLSCVALMHVGSKLFGSTGFHVTGVTLIERPLTLPSASKYPCQRLVRFPVVSLAGRLRPCARSPSRSATRTTTLTVLLSIPCWARGTDAVPEPANRAVASETTHASTRIRDG